MTDSTVAEGGVNCLEDFSDRRKKKINRAKAAKKAAETRARKQAQLATQGVI